mgnify:FL=1
MGLIEMCRRPDHTNIQPGWDQPRIKTDLLGDAMPSKPYVPRNLGRTAKKKK